MLDLTEFLDVPGHELVVGEPAVTTLARDRPYSDLARRTRPWHGNGVGPGSELGR